MLRTLARWGLVLGVIGWLGSIAVTAIARYLELNSVLEQVVIDTPPAGPRTETAQGQLRQVHHQIVQRAGRPDAPLAHENVVVTASPRSLWVTVRWSQPVLSWRGQTMWALPLSLNRTFANAP